MKLSEAGAALIAEFEGFRSAPYRDVVGVWTIGFGSTRGVGPHTAPLSREAALRRMMQEVDETYGAAVNALRLPLTQNQFDALVSFVYNVGPGGVAASTTVGKRLRAHDWRGAADALLAWDKAGGRALAGLTRRRKAERALFLSPSAGAATATGKWAHYTPEEVRLITEFDKLHGKSARAGLIDDLTVCRKRVWRVAQPKSKGGDGHGWGYRNRAARYRSLKARTT